MNERSLNSTKKSRLLRIHTRKRKVLVRDRDILEQKRAELAEIAFDLFLERGFHRTGVREIAIAAGLSVGAVFTYFRDKEEILAQIFFEQLGRAEKELLESLGSMVGDRSGWNQDPDLVFDAVFTQFLKAVDILRRFILLAYQETKSLNAPARKALIAREKRIQELLARAIRYGAERGRFAPDDIDLKAHCIMVLGHAWAVRHWMFVGVVKSIEEYREFLKPLVYSMLETGTQANIPTDGSVGNARRRATYKRQEREGIGKA
jgi:TetR/AcrR family transcriptional regulator, cholesterol catabolism regulator